MARHTQRFTVSDLGFGYGVHDTTEVYQVLEGEERGELPDSKNRLNSRILEIFPTRMAAQRYANELNAREEERNKAS